MRDGERNTHPREGGRARESLSMKNLLRLVLATVAFLGCVGGVLAQDYIMLDRRAHEFDRWQDRVDASYGAPPMTIISRETNVPVNVLEEQRTRTRFGYGGLLIGNAIATETGRSFDEVAALRANGRGWGAIAKQYGVKVGPIVSRIHRADVAHRGNGKLKHAEKKAEKFANGHDNRGGGNSHGNNGKHGGGKGKGHGKQ